MAETEVMAETMRLGDHPNHHMAMALTVFCSIASVLGGLLIFVLDLGQSEPDPVKAKKIYNTQLGHSLSFASGVMIFISFTDLMMGATETLGLASANFWMFGGSLGFAIVSWFIPDSDEMVVEFVKKKNNIKGDDEGMMRSRSSSFGDSVSSTPSSSIDTNNSEDVSETNRYNLRRRTRGTTGSADKKEERRRQTDAQESSREADALTNGISDEDDFNAEKQRRTGKLYMTGVVAALAVTLHNLPEGLAVYLAALKDGGDNHGSLFFGIFLHNIPEGLAVAMPLYAATGSKWRSVLWATLSGLAEPLGALIMGPVLGQLPEDRIQGVLAAVAGIMIYISLSELYPTALDYIDGQRATISCYCGMFVVFLAMHVLGH